MSRHHLALRVGAVLSGLMVAGAGALVLGPWVEEPASSGDALSTVSSVLAAGCCLHAARGSTGAARRSWALFGSTMALWALGDVLWSVSGLAGDLSSLVTVADSLYLLGLPPMAAGLLLFPVGKWERGAGTRLVLDAVVLGSALLLVSYLLVLREVLARVGFGWDALVYGVYPVTDVLMAGLAALLVLRTVGRPRLDLVLIGLAFTVWTAADNGYALMAAREVDYSRTLVEVAYVAAPLLLGLAALRGSASGDELRTVQRNVTGTLAAMLPDLTAVGAGALCIVLGLHDWQDWALATVAIGLMGLRQLVLTADHHLLRQTLETRVAERTRELQHLSHRHQRILESVGEGIFGIDDDGGISFVNPATERLLGWEPDELLGRDACATLCAEQHDTCPMTSALAGPTSAGETVTQSETDFSRRDGTSFPVEITAAPMLGSHDTRGAVVAFRDVTERHVVDLMKHEFVSAVSHELRTPLTAIRGSLEMLADGAAGELPPNAQEIVALAERGSERLTRLVNDIIDVERLQAGSFSVRPTPQDVAPLVEVAVLSMTALAEQSGVHLVVGPTRGRALGDADRVVQALVNLVGNALKFSSPGGTVDVSAVPDEHEVTFAVRDEGRGIPEAELETIFERFHQVNKSDSSEKGGTGLGLPITRSIVEQHDGRIWVESRPGVGSTFRFTLPVAPPAAHETHHVGDPEPALAPHRT